MTTKQSTKKRILVEVSPIQHAALKRQAAKLGLSLSNMMRRAWSVARRETRQAL